MGKIQVVAVNVEGDDGALSEAIRMAASLFQRDAAAEPAPAHPKLSQIVPIGKLPAPKKKGESVNAHGDFPCRHCERVLKSAQARGKHEASAHADKREKKFVEPADAKQYWCPVKNCGQSFKTQGWRDLHVERVHPNG